MPEGGDIARSIKILRGVPTDGNPLGPNRDGNDVIELQGFDRCSAAGRLADYFRPVVAPTEMIRPPLAARVEQWNGSPGLWIVRTCLCVFVAIARRTRPGQFSSGVARTADARHNMFADERGTRESGGMLTVFAAISGAVAHLPPHGSRNEFTPHP